MITESIGVACMFIAALAFSIPFGTYIARVFLQKRTRLDGLFNVFDRLIFRFGGIDPTREMTWKQHVKAMLGINLVWFVLTMLILTNMGWLPFNPDGNPSMSADLAFNTAVSFVTNTNLQHYSGETGMSYLGQLVLMLWQFLSAGTGIALAAMALLAMREKTSERYGNFYVLLVRTCTRVLLPVSLVVALVLVWRGVPMTFEDKDTATTLQGDSIQVSRGPVAAFVAIKHLGTNGGGFFGANSAHPFENPDYLTNMLEMAVQMILPFSMIFALGYVLRRRRLAWMIFGVMTLGFFLLLAPALFSEAAGNPALAELGIRQDLGNMEGKEVRFGALASAYWSIATTVISTGSVNAMHDSFMPLSNTSQLLAMMTNCFYGGCGVGLLNMYIFIILAVFISGLMVGRTPEFLGKKIEAREMKIAMVIALLHPLLILAGTALSGFLAATDPEGFGASLSNPGFHGFSQLLYEFTSAAANNGSGLEGLGDNTPFWNISCGLVMLLGRFLPIIGPVAIVGLLASKKYIPESSGTLRTDTATFGIILFAVIAIIAALSFFPALVLGPVAEYFSF